MYVKGGLIFNPWAVTKVQGSGSLQFPLSSDTWVLWRFECTTKPLWGIAFNGNKIEASHVCFHQRICNCCTSTSSDLRNNVAHYILWFLFRLMSQYIIISLFIGTRRIGYYHIPHTLLTGNRFLQVSRGKSAHKIRNGLSFVMIRHIIRPNIKLSSLYLLPFAMRNCSLGLCKFSRNSTIVFCGQIR